MRARSIEDILGLLRKTTQLEEEVRLCKQREKKVMAYGVRCFWSSGCGTSPMVMRNANVIKGCKQLSCKK